MKLDVVKFMKGNESVHLPERLATYYSLLFACLLATSLWLNTELYRLTVFNSLGIASFCILLVIAAACILTSIETLPPQVLFAWGVFCAWVIWVDCVLVDRYEALVRDLIWLWLPGFFWLFRQAFHYRNAVLIAFKLVACFLVGRAFLEIFLWYDSVDGHLLEPEAWGYSRHLGMSAGWMVLILGAEFEQGSSRYIAVFGRIFRLLALALVIWSGTRSAMLGLFLAGAFVAWQGRSSLSVKLLGVDIVLLLVFLALLPPGPDDGWLRIQQSIALANPEFITSGRSVLWANTLKGLYEVSAIFTGLGGNGFLSLQNDLGIFVLAGQHIQPHNVVVQMLCDWGLIGAGLFVVLYSSLWKAAFVTQGLVRNVFFWGALLYTGVIAGLDAGLYHIEFICYFLFAICLSVVPAASPKCVAPSYRWLWGIAIVVSAFIALPGWAYRLPIPHYFH